MCVDFVVAVALFVAVVVAAAVNWLSVLLFCFALCITWLSLLVIVLLLWVLFLCIIPLIISLEFPKENYFFNLLFKKSHGKLPFHVQREIR